LDGTAADKYFERHFKYSPGWHYLFAVALYNSKGKTVAVERLEIGGNQ